MGGRTIATKDEITTKTLKEAIADVEQNMMAPHPKPVINSEDRKRRRMMQVRPRPISCALRTLAHIGSENPQHGLF